MPRFKILPLDMSSPSIVAEAVNPAIVLHLITRIDCSEADVLEGERYLFSVRKGKVGAWTIFQRDHEKAGQGSPRTADRPTD
jgi:hypothetical protein